MQELIADKPKIRKEMKLCKRIFDNLKQEMDELGVENFRFETNAKLIKYFQLQAEDYWATATYWLELVKAMVYINRFETYS